MMRKLILTLSTLTIILSISASAQTVVQPCLASGQELLVNNEAVLAWKRTTKNQYHNRAHIQGTLVNVYPDHSGHHHYEVKIGLNSNDLIEVIYNEQFGKVPPIKLGASFEACGDYITSNAAVGHFTASPDGAIVHWVHKSPNPQAHDSGFIAVDGVVCGQD